MKRNIQRIQIEMLLRGKSQNNLHHWLVDEIRMSQTDVGLMHRVWAISSENGLQLVFVLSRCNIYKYKINISLYLNNKDNIVRYTQSIHMD